MNEYGVALCNTASDAMKAEKLLNEFGIEVTPIPVPREFSSDCGIALRFLWEQRTSVEEVLESKVEGFKVAKLGVPV